MSADDSDLDGLGTKTKFFANAFRFTRPTENEGNNWSPLDTIDIKTVDFKREKLTKNDDFVLKGIIARVPWPVDAPPVVIDDEDHSGSIALATSTLLLGALSLAALV